MAIESLLAAAKFTPQFLAILICWIFSVCIHEYAHALVAYWGGDKSVKDKGYLSFNFFAYIDPVGTFLIPAVFLALGGLPLPGGAVRIDQSALRSRHWSAAVSLAGPVSNFILFLILAGLVHPRTGLVDPSLPTQPVWAVVLGTMCVLEMWSVLFNLIPLPPLDGFGVIEPYLPPRIRYSARSMGIMGLVILYFVMSHRTVARAFMDMVDWFVSGLGLPFESTWRCYNVVFFGSSE